MRVCHVLHPLAANPCSQLAPTYSIFLLIAVHMLGRLQAALASVKIVSRLVDPGSQDYWLSMDRYVNWSSTALAKNDFYTDWKCRQMYKAHLKVFTHRINTVNGRMYKEDPTIFFWDLMNEPRWCGPAAFRC